MKLFFFVLNNLKEVIKIFPSTWIETMSSVVISMHGQTILPNDELNADKKEYRYVCTSILLDIKITFFYEINNDSNIY